MSRGLGAMRSIALVPKQEAREGTTRCGWRQFRLWRRAHFRANSGADAGSYLCRL